MGGIRLILVRIGFVLLCGVIGYYVGSSLSFYGPLSGSLGCIIASSVGVVVVALEFGLRRVSTRGLSVAVFGLAFGLIIAKLVFEAVSLVPLDKNLLNIFRVFIFLIFSYLGMVVALRGKDEFNLIIPYVRFSRQDQNQDIVIFDTSVIIDGRVVDICKTGFLQGKFLVPRFVLKELHLISDSTDALKRNRGRRGLDTLNKIQKLENLDVKITEEDFPEIKETDAKLVKLAKVLDGKIFTNDYNLNKVAQLEGVKVLNMNDLANALKPAVLPGETMSIHIIKEGKEAQQGIAYLDDGTMIVVEDAKKSLGKTKEILVTSVLQTSAGRMIFGKLKQPD